MDNLGSQFLEDFIKEDKPFLFGLTKRHLFLRVGLVVSVAILIYLYWIGFPDTLTALIGAILIIPTMLFGLSFDKRISLIERFYFGLLIKRRVYQTQHIIVKEYTRSDFIPEKGTSETDCF